MVTRRTTAALLYCVLGILSWAPLALAEAPDELQSARSALARYEFATGAARPLEALTQLTLLLDRNGLGRRERAEARFLRAAAASDLLILARVRGDDAISAHVEAAMRVRAGTLNDHLEAELAACSQPQFRELADQLRGALELSDQPQPWPWSRLRELVGAERDLLFLHQISRVATTERDAIPALSDYGVDPCASEGACPAPYQAFDARGRAAVFALAEAGRALRRLLHAADADDPLAAAAILEIATFVAALPAVELRPAPQLPHAGQWLDARGQALASPPDLVLYVSETGVRYGFAPRVRLRDDGELELFSPLTPTLPATADLAFRATLPAFMQAVPELVGFLSSPPVSTARGVAIVVQPNARAHRIGQVLASLRRAGRDQVIVAGESLDGMTTAQPVGIALRTEVDADPAPGAQGDILADRGAALALRVRLGGYTLVRGGASVSEDIPRIRDKQGWRFDGAALASRLDGHDYSSSRLSFMGDVAAEQVVVALLETAKASRALDIVLP